MVYVNVFGLSCGAAGDVVILHAERVYVGGAGSKCEDVARDWKPDAKVAAAAKAAVGGNKMFKAAFKMTVPAGVVQEGGPGVPTEFLRGRRAAMDVLSKHGLAGSLKTSWESGESSDASAPAWAAVKLKADPTGMALKKVLQELKSACEG